MSPPFAPRVERDSLGTLSEIARGGQGRVFSFSADPSTLPAVGYTELLYKEYDSETLAEFDVSALVAQVCRASAITRCGLGRRLAWPLMLVTVGDIPTGFLMQRAPLVFSVELALPRGPERKLGELQYALNGPEYTAQMGLPLTDRWRALILRSVATEMSALHQQQITVGDLSPKNLLASFSDEPSCFFLDCDAMDVDGRSVCRQVETADWEVPPGERLATVHSDSFKFALLATRLFAQSQDAREVTAIARFDSVLGELAYRGLRPDPSARPRPDHWIPALDAAAATAAEKKGLRDRSTGRPGAAPTRGGLADEPPTNRGDSSAGSTRTRRRGTLGMVLAGVVVSALVLLVGLGVANQGNTQPSQGSAPAPTSGTDIGAASSGAVPAPNLNTNLVTVSPAVAAQPRAPEVVQLVDRYFSAINAGDFDAWEATVVPDRAGAQSRGAWTTGYRSTIDQQVSLSSIADDGSGGVTIGLSFVSRQDVADAPPTLQAPRICWSATWPLEQTSNGLRLGRPGPGSTSAQAC